MGTISIIFFAILIIDCSVGFYAWVKKRLDKHTAPLLIAVACSFLDEVLAHYFRVKYRNNLVFYHFSGAIEYALFVWFIYVNVSNIKVRKAIVFSIILYISITFIYGIWFVKEAYADPYSALTHHNYFVIAKGLLLTLFSICYFKGIFDSISRYEYLDIYILLSMAGILFYYAFSTVYFAGQTYLIGRALEENPNLFTDILKRRSAAFSYAFKQFKDISTFLFLTNILLYLCALVTLCKNAFGKKAVGNLQF